MSVKRTLHVAPRPPPSCKVYTPTELAKAMVDALGDAPGVRWLEPSHGRGVFVQAISSLNVPRARIVALDLDVKPAEADSLATTIRGEDFLRWYGVTRQRFDRIVGNPPFVAISRLRGVLKASAASVRRIEGGSIGKGANTWYCFVQASFHLLKDGGSFAFVLPSAAEYADYSKDLRESVGRFFRSLEVYRSLRPLFPTVQEGTVVAIGRGYKQGPCVFHRGEVDTIEELRDVLRTDPARNARRCRGWQRRSRANETTLGEVARIGIGGVTGDARFFLLTEARRLELGLPRECVVPVVSRARHLAAGVVDRAAWVKLRDADKRVWLFRPTKKSLARGRVRDYLARSRDQGGCRRSGYKVRIREPWYETVLPARPHGFISGMGQRGPWVCFNEMAGLNATNTLYVITFLEPDKNLRFGWALSMLLPWAQRQIRRLGRRYADGLRKYEPGSLTQIRLIRPPARSYRRAYLRAVRALLRGDVSAAQGIALAAFKPAISFAK